MYLEAKSIAIVDSIATYKKVCGYNIQVILTDNFLLYKKINNENKIKIIYTENYIEQDDIDVWGKAFVGYGVQLDKELNFLAKSHSLKGSIQEANSFFMFLLSLICKVEGLKRSVNLEKLENVIICSTHNKLWEKSKKHERFISTYTNLAKNNFFGNAKVKIEIINTNFLDPVNYTLSNNYLLRVLSAKIIDNFIWKISNFNIFTKKFSKILFSGDAEIIRESISKLFFQGKLCVSYSKILSKGEVVNELKKSKEEELFKYKKDIEIFLNKKILDAFNYNKNQTDSIVNILLFEIDKNLKEAQRKALETNLFFEKIKLKFPNIKIIMVSAPNTTIAKYFHEVAKKNNKILINFEHGLTTGISMRNKYYMYFSEATNCDYMFVANKLAKKEYESIGKQNIAKIHDIGIASQCKNIPYKNIQRNINRNTFNIKRNEFCICHVSTLLLNGSIRYGPHTPRDQDVVNLNNMVIENVYGKLKEKKVIFKDYPSRRFIYQPSLKEIWHKRNSNIFFEEKGDWRYIRAAADLIVTMTPTSTFSWCLGAKVPLVWLNLPWAKLRYEWLNKSFKDAFFCFDTLDKNWTLDLLNFLSCSRMEINKMWDEKKQAREKLIYQHLFSKDNAAKKASQIITELL